MKNKALLALLLVLFGCSHRKAHTPEPGTKKTPDITQKTRAVFHVIEPLGIDLILYNLDKKFEEKIHMDKTLSHIGLKEGHWQIIGFVLNGQRYKLPNTTHKFIFNLKKDHSSYVGSYIFQCPKVGPGHLKEMKKMSFFNRYPFTSDKRLCEMVVGSDFENVNRVWLELESKDALVLGF